MSGFQKLSGVTIVLQQRGSRSGGQGMGDGKKLLRFVNTDSADVWTKHAKPCETLQTISVSFSKPVSKPERDRERERERDRD